MDRQALRDAVMRFNAEGLGGLVDRPRPSREPRLSEGEQAALAGLILRGPRPEQSGLSSWTLADLCQEVEASWGKRFHPASMSRVVCRLEFSRQKARQVHPQSDAQAQAAFAKNLGRRSWLSADACAEVLPGFGEAEEWAGYQCDRSRAGSGCWFRPTGCARRVVGWRGSATRTDACW